MDFSYSDGGPNYFVFHTAWTDVEGSLNEEVEYIHDGQAAIFRHTGSLSVFETSPGIDYEYWNLQEPHSNPLIVPHTPGNIQIHAYKDGYCAPNWHTLSFPSIDLLLPVQMLQNWYPVKRSLLRSRGSIEFRTGCAGVFDDGDRTPNWFVLNSGGESHVTFALTETFRNVPTTNHKTYVQVLEDGPEPGCGDQTLIACLSDPGIVDIDVADYTDVLPNTDYYLVLHSVPTIEFEVVGVASAGPVSLTGCADPTSCNYLSEFIFEDCPPMGCTDQLACNYNSSAGCDDGSCDLPDDLEVLLYQDENYNGNKDGFEDYIGGIGAVVIAQGDVPVFTVIPGADGQVVIPDMPEGDYTAYFYDASGVWTDNGVLDFSFPRCDAIKVGGYPTPDSFDHYSQFLGHTQTEIHCDAGEAYAFWLLNIGSEPLSGSVNITFDEGLTVSPNGIPWTATDANSASWIFDNHLPGDASIYGIDVAAPGVDLIGEVFSFSIEVTLTNAIGEVIYTASHSSEVTVVCAYDPNDKTLMDPETYTDSGYIASDSETLSYRIRFQNTGNAPATNVVIEDPINLERFDISTLTPTYASHGFYTIIETDGRVKFIFENIMLPDSMADLEGSQGEIYYQIDLLPEVTFGDLIENSAEIYFDSNPAVLTNPTSNQLFDCAWMQALSSEVACIGSGVTIDPELLLSTDYSWELDDLPIGEVNTPLSLDTPETGTGEVTILLSNPICEPLPQTLTYEVITHLPQDFDLDGNVGSNDLLTLIGEFACFGECTTDLDEDGFVGTQDILLLLQAFGSTCN